MRPGGGESCPQQDPWSMGARSVALGSESPWLESASTPTAVPAHNEGTRALAGRHWRRRGRGGPKEIQPGRPPPDSRLPSATQVPLGAEAATTTALAPSRGSRAGPAGHASPLVDIHAVDLLMRPPGRQRQAVTRLLGRGSQPPGGKKGNVTRRRGGTGPPAQALAPPLPPEPALPPLPLQRPPKIVRLRLCGGDGGITSG